ncbi:MarR family transcriptional regulator [Lactiplantibacillus garii]|uniref:MarR family transcriptional regulator n=1 Tax=Lactiplantibacillus garii TaxID=2306423 RepID=A0A426D7W6_9LACO|nr:MarR family transcriptional regulator [Lactiplantibacillus garii]RRK10709.1 MarR family transcriptional regulator [Lactiplantibacillus garii]
MSKSSELNYLLRSLQVKEQRLYNEKTSNYDLSPSQARALIYIESHPGTNQKAVADYFGLRGASTSTLIKKLADAGYLEKKPSRGSQDRSNKLFLTAAGLELVVGLKAAFTSVEERLVASLTTQETATLIQLLTKVDRGLAD